MRSRLGKDLSVVDSAGFSKGLASQSGIATVLNFLEKAEIFDRDDRGDRLPASSENDALATACTFDGARKTGRLLLSALFPIAAPSQPGPYSDRLAPRAQIVCRGNDDAVNFSLRRATALPPRTHTGQPVITRMTRDFTCTMSLRARPASVLPRIWYRS